MLNWARDGASWPLSVHSRFVECGRFRWHVQAAGSEDPVLLLVHGSGGSTHSWRAVLEALPEGLGWVAVDLPGHAFTEARVEDLPRGPVEHADALYDLLQVLTCQPHVLVGHSAGAGIAIELARRVEATDVVAVAPSLGPPPGGGAAQAVSGLFGPLLGARPTAEGLARIARKTRAVESLLDATGSRVPTWSRDCYRRLFGDPGHVAAVLRLFLRWRPVDVARRGAGVHLTTLLGTRDRWISARSIRRAFEEGPDSVVHALGGGHLVHEEAPDVVAGHLAGIALGREC